MKVWKKKTVQYVNGSGKRVQSGTPNAKRKVIESKKFYGTLKKANGKNKQIPLSEDRETSQTLLRSLQTDEDRKRALGITEADENRERPIKELLKEYEKELKSRGNTAFHVSRTMDCINAILKATKANTLSDLTASSVTNTLSRWRKKGRPQKRNRTSQPLSIERSNVYARAIKGFTRWLWVQRKSEHDILQSVQLMNANVDRRRKRRALTEDEIRLLLEKTGKSKKTYRGNTWTFPPADRTMLYALAIGTGLRAAELASLTVSSIDLKTNTITLNAAYSKHRREDVLPLHPSLVERLTVWIKGRRGKLFPGTWAAERRQAKILRRDLKEAGIEYEDEQGRYADFHALRHTFVSSLARSGVHPSKAKELARHSTITLTMDVYSHVETEELRSALDSVPGF
ncbi:Tyrosine recombinase XerC [Gimesia panareensis]|uniref:Tyrosine recombinase XerC n=1 Tax=Gimesia panareensis TaxID=2527978 RepID=A0A518FT06_9PLAN|nr:site-specific integrase [Gimesia panareensis]QDV19486.1 Tyrosine recombinase XerC [Gimesia panareensis]